jgi:hypothetical protein
MNHNLVFSNLASAALVRLFLPALLYLIASVGCVPFFTPGKAQIEAHYAAELSQCYAKLEEKFAENRRLYPQVPALNREVTERDRQFDCRTPLSRRQEYEEWAARNPLMAWLQENGGGIGSGSTLFVMPLR